MRSIHFFKLLLVVGFLLSTICVKAQEPVTLSITEAQGLPSNEIYSMEEDAKGFVWLATNKGLVRYDGTTFQSYAHPEQVGLSVFDLFVDQMYRVWCMNLSGQIFYAQDDDFVLFANVNEEFKGSLGNLVANEEELVVSYFKSRVAINLKTKEKKVSDIPQNSFSYGLVAHHDGNIFQPVGKYFKIIKNSQVTNKYLLPSSLHDEALRPQPIRTVFLPNGNLYLIQELLGKSLKVFIRENDGWTSLNTPADFKDVRIQSVHAHDNQLFFSTNKGVLICERNGSDLLLNQSILQDFFTTDTFIDNDQNIWISTLRSGLIVVPNIHVREHTLPATLPTRIEKLSNDHVAVGFENGNIGIVSSKTEEMEVIKFPTSTAVSTLLYDKQNSDLFVFQKLYNYRYDLSTRKIAKLENQLTTVKKASLIGTDTILYASAGFIAARLLKENEFTKRDEFLFQQNIRGYTALHTVKSDQSYLASVEGLHMLTKDLQLNPITFKNLPILTRNLIEDNSGNVWAGSFKNGLYKINGEKVVDHISTHAGLASQVINALAVDGDYLWICTDNALQRYHIPSGSFNTLYARDGIPSFSIVNMTMDGDYLYMNTPLKLFSIQKEKVFKPLYIPDYYFTEVQIDGKTQEKSDKYIIENKNTPTTIFYNVNGLRGLTSGNFEYRIKNHTEWTAQPQGANSIQFASLPLGKLTFELRQLGSDKIKSLKLIVTQPFYQRLWFWLLMATLIMAFIIFYYRRKLRFRESEKNKELRQLALDNELITLRLENLRSQMNPHFIFNALNSIQEYIVSNERKLASSYLVKFSRLIRMYLDQSRENQIPLKEELQAMQLYLDLEKVRFEEKLDYSLQVDERLDQDRVMLPPLFIQPYVENSLKHGLLHKKDNRELHVVFQWDGATDSIIICVTDNGIGREASQELKKQQNRYHKSFATYANQERVDLLNSKRHAKLSVKIIDLKDNNEQSCGTQVCITIPQQL
ncbi:sensor histidine kinase [Nonlabens tegetincola]|nr:histidine kinase [Nonlabens tegetincola]